jgi:glycosyltransferase involved in cell wall biosynthesis
MLSQVTPVILTLNEAPNIGETLSRLTWARDVVVVDSLSADDTLRIVRRFANVRVFERAFDSHHGQWRFAIEDTAVGTPWILRLDADYKVPPALVAEMETLDPNAPYDAYEVAFDYAVYGRRLRASLYPPKPILMRRGRFSIRDAGHTEAWDIRGPVGKLTARVVHDDWKPTSDWVTAQARYMRRELDKPPAPDGRLRDWLRRHPPLMPIVAFLYTLIGKGLILDGKAGVFYALQRAAAESVYALLLLERRLRGEAESDD